MSPTCHPDRALRRMGLCSPCYAATHKEGWHERVVSLGRLAYLANQPVTHYGIFEWLQAVGIVPLGASRPPVSIPRLNINPGHIPVGYLASVAAEWDTWGPSTPAEFINAMECEMGGKADLVSETLASLGRQRQEVAA